MLLGVNKLARGECGTQESGNNCHHAELDRGFHTVNIRLVNQFLLWQRYDISKTCAIFLLLFSIIVFFYVCHKLTYSV